MSGRLDGKVAIVTGGGSGIGRACALRFASEGAAVGVVDLSLEGAAVTVNNIEEGGGRAVALQLDTSDEAATTAMVDQSVAALGGVDILVAAAGISSATPASERPAEPASILTMPTDRVRRVIDVNLFGVLFSDRAVARWMIGNRRGGSIINLASVAAKVPLPGGAYSISKAGVWMLTKVMAMELAGTGIRVNAIGPGFIETPMTEPIRSDEAGRQWALQMTPMARFGQPEEVASTALFLASDESSFFTGELLHPSGGVFAG